MSNRPPIRAARDLNETEIVDGLRGIPGVRVYLIDRPCDAIVGFQGSVYLMEFKSRTGRLTASQVAFHAEWYGMVHVVRTLEDALTVLGIKVSGG